MLQSLRIQDILDIAIISISISVLLIWIKDRASRFVFIGISLLGFIYIIAKFFQLYLTTVVLQGFFAILLFVLVVIFQEDLRRFFERLAILGIIRKKIQRTTPHGQTSEIIAQTVADFARKHFDYEKMMDDVAVLWHRTWRKHSSHPHNRGFFG